MVQLGPPSPLHDKLLTSLHDLRILGILVSQPCPERTTETVATESIVIEGRWHRKSSEEEKGPRVRMAASAVKDARGGRERKTGSAVHDRAGRPSRVRENNQTQHTHTQMASAAMKSWKFPMSPPKKSTHPNINNANQTQHTQQHGNCHNEIVEFSHVSSQKSRHTPA